jgi:acetyl-CoA acetyltransferase
MADRPVITASGQTPARRAGTGSCVSTPELLFSAADQARAQAGLRWSDIDGLAVSSFTLAPDHAIDLAVSWNLNLRWIMDSALGGASGIDMLEHALAALHLGTCSTILIVAGDHFGENDFTRLVRTYNRSATTDFPDVAGAGPNAFFAMVTQLQMAQTGLQRADYGSIAVRQRQWAAHNPNAAFRAPLTLDEYLAAPMIADPLGRYDCVPVISGASALVLQRLQRPERPQRDATGHAKAVAVRAIGSQHNIDGQDGDGTSTGLTDLAPRLWDQAGVGPRDIDVVSVYDDYPAMVVAQLLDAGFLEPADVPGGLTRLLQGDRPALNCSGGQLSAGQSGAGAGLQGLVEVVRCLMDQGPPGTQSARLGFVSGYGMVTYRYGTCANAAVLEVS